MRRQLRRNRTCLQLVDLSYQESHALFYLQQEMQKTDLQFTGGARSRAGSNLPAAVIFISDHSDSKPGELVPEGERVQLPEGTCIVK